jgi:serine protease Do
MKYISFIFLSAFLDLTIPNNIWAQVKSETQEIIIKKDGDKPTKFTIEFDGGKVNINGKPIAEFKEDGITINNRKMIIKEGNKITMDFGDGIGDLNDEKGSLRELRSIDIQRLNPERIDMDIKAFRQGAILGVMLKDADNKGALIEEVTENSGAAKAGLKTGDIIYKINDVNIKAPKDLMDFMKDKKKDEEVKVYYEKSGTKKDVMVKLQANSPIIKKFYMDADMPNGSVRSFTFPQMREGMKPLLPQMSDFPGRFLVNSKTKLGIKIQDTEEGNGVKILSVEDDLVGAKAGLKKDDIITNIADKKITNTDEAREALNENRNNLNYDIKVLRSGKPVTVAIKIPKQLKTANL